MTTVYSDVSCDVNCIKPSQHKFYKSTFDLLGLLIFFQKKSNGCFASTQWLSRKLDITPRAVLMALKKLEEAGYITRSKDGRRRVITCLVKCLPKRKAKPKTSRIQHQKLHVSNSSYIEQRIHNTNPDVDVVVDALENEGIKPIVARSLAQRYSKQQVRAIINACRKNTCIKNKAAWIVSGLSKGWNVGSSVEEPPKYQLFQRPQQAPDRSGYKDGIAMIRERLGIVRR